MSKFGIELRTHETPKTRLAPSPPKPFRRRACSRGCSGACGSPGPPALCGEAPPLFLRSHASSRPGAAPFRLHPGVGTDPELTCPSTSSRTLRTAHRCLQAQLFGIGAEPPLGLGRVRRIPAWGGEKQGRSSRLAGVAGESGPALQERSLPSGPANQVRDFPWRLGPVARVGYSPAI